MPDECSCLKSNRRAVLADSNNNLRTLTLPYLRERFTEMLETVCFK